MCIRGKKIRNELSLSTLSCLPWVDDLFQHDIVITGGEPTLHKDFTRIVQYFASRSKSVSICTNGIRNDYISKEFFAPNTINIQISVDGDREHHDEIRGKGTYDSIFRTISCLENIGVQYTISSVVSKNNYRSMKILADTLSRLKHMSYWNVSYEMPFGNADYSELMKAEEWNNFVDEMLNYVRFRLRIQRMFPFELFDRNKDKIDKLFKGGKCSNCGSGREKIYIYPDFTVYPCTCLTDFPLGNLKEQPLNKIMNNEKACLFSDYKVCEGSVCSKCEYLNYCNGGCIGMSYSHFRALGMGDIRCPKIRDAEQTSTISI